MQTILFITNHPKTRLIKENGECEEKEKVRENRYLLKFSCYLQTLVDMVHTFGTEMHRSEVLTLAGSLKRLSAFNCGLAAFAVPSSCIKLQAS